MINPRLSEPALRFVTGLLEGDETTAWAQVSQSSRDLLACVLYIEHHLVLARAVGVADSYFQPQMVLGLLEHDAGGLRHDWLTAMAHYARQCGWQYLTVENLKATRRERTIALTRAEEVTAGEGLAHLNVPLVLLEEPDNVYQVDLAIVLALRVAKAKTLTISARVARNKGQLAAARYLLTAAAGLSRIYDLLGHEPFNRHLATIGTRREAVQQDVVYTQQAAGLLATLPTAAE